MQLQDQIEKARRSYATAKPRSARRVKVEHDLKNLVLAQLRKEIKHGRKNMRGKRG